MRILRTFYQLYRESSRTTYGSFLRAFLPRLTEGIDSWQDIDVGDASDLFDAYCVERSLRPTTGRSYRYALRSFLSSRGVEMGVFDLASSPWKTPTRLVFPSDYERFRKTVGTLYEGQVASEVILISDLAYFTGLTTNEILHLSVTDFYRFESGYRLEVKAVSKKSRERVVLVPQCMEKSLLNVISNDPHPLFSLGRKEKASDSYEAKKWRLRALISEAEKKTNENVKDPLRYDLKAFRTSRILLDLYDGDGRKDVCERYGVGKDYVSRLMAKDV